MKLSTLFRQLTVIALAFATTACQGEDKKEAIPVNPPKDLSKLSKAELEKTLDKEAYYVCIMGGTERPFQNKYWNNHAAGVYVDVISGKALFASTNKFESGSGWPSFFDPIDKSEIESIEDKSHGMTRTEVRAKTSGAHLGHVFPDGPKPTGLRYCINSAALRFVPVADLQKAGLEKYQPLFAEEPKKEEPKK